MTDHLKHKQQGLKKTRAASGEKSALHPRNLHRGRYDFRQLIRCAPDLAQFVAMNEYGDESIDFADPSAVKALNRALLAHYYGVTGWDIPAQYLCPPIPGRSDYLHYLADLLAEGNGGVIPRGTALRVLDVGIGANCIYPLIGHAMYGWQFVGTDIDPVAISNAQRIVEANSLGKAIELRLQASPAMTFSGVLKPGESFDLSMCNPPFHASLNEARVGTQRKWQNLGKAGASNETPTLNFGGQGMELCCAGGEEAFVSRMVEDSARHRGSCRWFTTLISKSASLPSVYRALKNARARDVRTIEVAQGQKKSRIVVWTFLDSK